MVQKSLWEETALNVQGCLVHKGFLDDAQQRELLGQVRLVTQMAPLRRYETRSGRKMSVAMSAAGKLGWFSDRKGYRYEAKGPGGDWPDIPEIAQDVWKSVADVGRAPDTCLLNFYCDGARMGMHQDLDEAETVWPVVSISIGDPALFRIGTTLGKSPSKSVWLESGDVAVLTGEARLAWHGVDRIRFGESGLLERGGRINLTLRVAGHRDREQHPE